MQSPLNVDQSAVVTNILVAGRLFFQEFAGVPNDVGRKTANRGNRKCRIPDRNER
jgi:hypothetical protein